MEKNRNEYIFDRIKQAFSLKRTKFTLYMVMVLWLAFATQMVVNRVFHDSFKITEAFVKTNTEEMQSSIEVIAESQSEFLSESDKKAIIQKLADAIGLNIDKEISVWRDDARSEFSFVKMAKQATSEIKVISLEQKENTIVKMKHYIIVRLTIMQSIQNIDMYKNKLENALNTLGIKNKQLTMQYEGNYDGELSLKEKEQIAAVLVDDLQGQIANQYDEGDLYTVYAYTGLQNEYIESMGSKINLQIAISYNELTNKTRVYLATPILNQNW